MKESILCTSRCGQYPPSVRVHPQRLHHSWDGVVELLRVEHCLAHGCEVGVHACGVCGLFVDF